MDSDTTDQKAIMDEMSTVTDIEKILPEQISTWDKKTTSLVLGKALHLCRISISSEEKTDEEMKTEQERIQKQIEALQQKKDEKAKLLHDHQIVRHRRAVIQRRMRGLRSMGNFFRAIRIPAQQVLGAENAEFRQKIERLQRELDGLNSPLRD